MDGLPADGITEIAQQAVEAVSKSENNWAAIILLIALLGVLGITFVIARASMKDRADRATARELQLRDDAARLETNLRRDYETQLERSRITQDFIARMNDRYDATMNRVTEAFGENSAILRQSKEEIRKNAEALNRNTDVLERLEAQQAASNLPKRSRARRPFSQEGANDG
jgi:cbb3-type cytochrome oxidase subunit 3